MPTKVLSLGLLGIEAIPVDVEVAVAPGLPAFNVSGMPEHAAKETSVRVRSALEQAGFKLPPRRVTITLSGVPTRETGAYDLAIAVGLLAEMDLVPRESVREMAFAGELALDGSLRRIPGAPSMAIGARDRLRARGLILPGECASEAAGVNFPVHAAASIGEVRTFLRGEWVLPIARPPVPLRAREPDLEVCGPAVVRRALEVAAAGGHNLLLVGPPGSSKGMLARRLPALLPAMTDAENLETSMIYAAVGAMNGYSALSERPFRAPHHSISVAGLISGGVLPRPGEAALANHGALFLDELPEFKRAALEGICQPLEDHRVVVVVRSQATVVYPASFLLVASMNPCPCGFHGSEIHGCLCSDEAIARYWNRVPARLMRHFDLRVNVPHIHYKDLAAGNNSESVTTVRARVTEARARRLGFGIADVARTIACLAGRDEITADDIDEAGALSLGAGN